MATAPNTVPMAFERAANKLLGKFTDEEQKKYFGQPTSIGDIWDLVENLQAQQASRGALQNMARIEPFIKGMTQYAKVIEVFVQVKPEIMALIWGPLKLLLQLASQFAEVLEKILDAISRIGENLPRFGKLSTAFSSNDHIQEIISIVYVDIMDFYICAWKFFNRRVWNIVFSLAWASFEDQFGPILRDLQRHQNFVDKEVHAEDIIQSQKAREEELKRIEERQLDDMHRKMKDIFDWLKPVNVVDRREKYGRLKQDGTGKWLIKNKDIKNWITGKGKQSVWLTGKPGSGKTILSYTLLEHLELEVASISPSSLVLYYFCSYEEADLITLQNILSTLIYQIISQKQDLLAYIYPEITKLLSVSMLQKVLCDLIEASVPPSGFVYIIIDGLDELPKTERDSLLRILGVLRRKPLSLASRIFVASRDLAEIRAVLEKPEKHRPPALVISIKENNRCDINRYISHESQKLVDDFGFEGEQLIAVQKEIENSLSTRADGMFLWVHLVIESLRLQDSAQEIREALGSYPKGLSEVYERIINRIRRLDERQRSKAKKTLEWITCTYRPLRIDELEDALSMEPCDFTLDREKRPYIIRLRRLCGPIIELSKGVVTFVHFTAKEYLLNPRSGPFIDRISSHLRISTICITYQCFRCFELGISNDEAVGFLLKGDLRLFDYVHSNWFEHIREFCRLNPDQNQIDVLSASLKVLFRRKATFRNPYQATAAPNSEGESALSGVLGVREFSRFEPELKTSLISILQFRKELEKQNLNLGPGDALSHWCDENNPLTFVKGARRLQDTLEELLHEQPPDRLKIEAARKAYGENLYFCRYRFCQNLSGDGFSTYNERRLHEERLHIKPYRCLVEGCILAGARPFTSKALLRKHTSNYHTVAPDKVSVVDIEILSELFQTMKYGDRNPRKREKLHEVPLIQERLTGAQASQRVTDGIPKISREIDASVGEILEPGRLDPKSMLDREGLSGAQQDIDYYLQKKLFLEANFYEPRANFDLLTEICQQECRGLERAQREHEVGIIQRDLLKQYEAGEMTCEELQIQHIKLAWDEQQALEEQQGQDEQLYQKELLTREQLQILNEKRNRNRQLIWDYVQVQNDQRARDEQQNREFLRDYDEKRFRNKQITWEKLQSWNQQRIWDERQAWEVQQARDFQRFEDGLLTLEAFQARRRPWVQARKQGRELQVGNDLEQFLDGQMAQDEMLKRQDQWIREDKQELQWQLFLDRGITWDEFQKRIYQRERDEQTARESQRAYDLKVLKDDKMAWDEYAWDEFQNRYEQRARDEKLAWELQRARDEQRIQDGKLTWDEFRNRSGQRALDEQQDNERFIREKLQALGGQFGPRARSRVEEWLYERNSISNAPVPSAKIQPTIAALLHPAASH